MFDCLSLSLSLETLSISLEREQTNLNNLETNEHSSHTSRGRRPQVAHKRSYCSKDETWGVHYAMLNIVHAIIVVHTYDISQGFLKYFGARDDYETEKISFGILTPSTTLLQ